MKHLKNLGFEWEFGINDSKSVVDVLQLSIDEYDSFATLEDFEDLDTPADFDDIEIASIPMAFGKSMKLLRKVLHKMKSKDVVTNDECGLHVNMSFKDARLTYAVDPVELMLLFDEKKWLQLFGRHNSFYCKPHLHPALGTSTNKTYTKLKQLKKRGLTPEELRGKLNVSTEKYSSVNFSHISDAEYNPDGCRYDEETIEEYAEYEYDMHPYWEIRIAGGEDYEHRYNHISGMIKEFGIAMDKCIAGKSKRELNSKTRKLIGHNWQAPSVPH